MSGWNGMRILLVGPSPPPAGGMANQTRQLAELLRAEGALVELVQTNAPCSPAWLGRVKGLRALARLLPYLWRLLVATGRNDVMHLMANSGWSWHLMAAPALCVARLRGLPVVVNYRGGGAAAFLARSAGLVRPVMRLSSALVVPSGFLQQVFAGYGMPAQVVPNIVDLQRFRPSAQTVPEPAHLVVTRNLEPVYDNASAIRALALVRQTHPQARLTVAGSGPELPRLQALVQELGLQTQVHFTGRLDRDPMAALYGQAGVMLNPSLTDNMPNSVLEALASGVPVVSTDVGGVPFLLQDGVTGLLVPPAQPQALAQAVLRLLAEPALRARLVDNGLREAQRYTWAQVAPLLLGVYRQARPAHRAKAA